MSPSIDTPQRVAVADVGGSSVKRGIVSLTDLSVWTLPSTPLDASGPQHELLSMLGAAIAAPAAELQRSPSFNGQLCVGVAFPAPMNYADGVPFIRGQRKFDSIYGVPLRPAVLDPLVRSTGDSHRDIDIRFVNDAAAAATGEARFGAGVGAQRMLMITLGTGFGAAAIIGGESRETVGDVEVGRLYERAVPAVDGATGRADDVLSAVGLAGFVGVAPAELPAAAEAARSGATTERFTQFGRQLGEFVGPIVQRLELDRVVVGGGGSRAFDLFGRAAQRSVRCQLVAAELGDDAALLGAATLFQR